MCVVSLVGDHYSDKWTSPLMTSSGHTVTFTAPVTREEFEVLKKDVLEMKALLIKAKLYDEQTGQKDCEMETKLATLRKIADLVGVSLDDVIPKK